MTETETSPSERLNLNTALIKEEGDVSTTALSDDDCPARGPE